MNWAHLSVLHSISPVIVFHFTVICPSRGLIRPLLFTSFTKQDHDASVGDLWSYRMIHLAGFERKVLTIIIQFFLENGIR